MASNPLSYKDLFDFSDNGGIKGALRDIAKLKDVYKDFIDTVINGNIAGITAQQNALADSARQLATATRDLNVTTTAGQKSLIENAKLMAQLEAANKKLAATQQSTTNINNSAASSINALDAKLKEQIALYKQASSASEQDRAAMDRMAASINRTRAEINQMSSAIKTNVNGFNAARGSYAALDAETRQLVTSLKQLENGTDSNNAAAQALQQKIYQNTARLKEFDAAMNQNFRNVGNYRSALSGLGGQFESYIGQFVSLYAGIRLAGSILKSNEEISDSIADVRRTAQLTAKEADNLVESLKKLDTRTSLKGLLDIAIVGGRLGIAKDNLVGFTEAADKLTQALGSELGNTEDITTGLGKIINIFSDDKNITGDRLLHLGNAIVDLANKGVASGKYIVDFTQRLAGIAGVAKLSLGSTIGLGAGLEELGTSAEVGGTAVTQLLFKIGQDVPKYAKLAGKSVEDFGLTLKKAPVEALIELGEGLAKNKTGFAEISESFKEAEAKGVRVAGTLAVIGQNGDFLRGKINSANEALLKTNEITDAAKLKNDNLAGSVDKLAKSFENLTTKNNVATFLQTNINLLTDFTKAIDRAVNSDSWKEFFVRLGGVGARLQGNALQGTVADILGGINKKASDSDIAAAAAEQFKKLPIDKQQTQLFAQTGLRDSSYDIVQGTIKDGGKPTSEQLASMYQEQKILVALRAAYAELHPARAQAIADSAKEGEVEALTVKQIRQKIIDLQNDILKNPQNKATDIDQILKLKAQLKELSGTAAPAKNALENLEDQVKKLNDALLNGLADGVINKADRDLQKRIAQAQAEIKKIKDLQFQLQNGPAPGPAAQGATAPAIGKIPQLDRIDQRNNNLLNASDFADQAQNVEQEYADLNRKLLNDYLQHTITREQYDAQAAQLSEQQSNARYFNEKARLANLLLNTEKGSKEYISLKEQEANLDARHSQQQIDAAKKVEEARLKAIEVVTTYLNKSLAPLSQQLGEGFGTIFSSLTSDLENFAKNGKLSFTELADTAVGLTNGITQAFVASSQARIDQLTAEHDHDIEAAGDNAAAKKAIDDRYNKAVAAEKRKQAKLEKEAALISIAINTAVAVVKALPNIPLAIAIGVLGAVELALVAAKPLPKYKGGRNGGPGELAIVNDGKGPEAIVKGNKIRFAGQGKETATFLEPGESVWTAEKTAKAISDDQNSSMFVESLIAGTGVVMNHEKIVSSKMIDAIVSSKMSPEMLTACFRSALSDLEIQQLFMDEKGTRTYNKRRNQLILDHNARNTIGGNG